MGVGIGVLVDRRCAGRCSHVGIVGAEGEGIRLDYWGRVGLVVVDSIAAKEGGRETVEVVEERIVEL